MYTKEIKHWRYDIPQIDGEGWGTFLLDETGMFAAVTDYGNCAYKWPHSGCEDFRHFFAQERTNWGYFLPKLFYELKEYDGDETLQRIKEYIISCRRDGTFTREKARQEWDLLERHDWLYGDFEFAYWYDETSISDAEEFYIRGYPSSALAFVNKLLPRLSKAIREELAREGIE
ncbi:hypothetical protein ABNB59_06440 [Paenibacillus larvae]|uniref:Uncharacterized protein n=3 Tax=Paenibacillus larvae TaxID=1464 RepID=V9W4N6_9BACL|nr:hypothetical protein [Paenibacillus larvae]AHD04899.1 hypothetical protein ERIC2_c10640 [Paenibacillus larvae subsp. larvae DSM 25430]AQR77455.1 hypothetical protein BXP28_08935 [Paenibacillus larvae subsp. larvae]AVF21515.1 hypothetical protein ERICI_01637 [Paenibacillus larvae subsp. larvae]AVG11440.1 hypothetical protein ERICII_01021 [Paenibacillus larvae subsp. larvae DSM 25430]ETK30305.1 hypothetical protein ERIC1_1c38720 [Paenibacillus larvae subsp. larvae DSM 25719]